MRKRFSSSLVAVATLGLLGTILWCNAWAESVRDTLVAAEQHWAKLYNAKDAAGMAMTYSADAMRLPPDASRVQGRAAIQAHLQKELNDGLNNIRTEVTDFGHDGNLAWLVGKFAVDYPTEKGTATATGNYVMVYRKEADGVWRAVIETWNDTPTK